LCPPTATYLGANNPGEYRASTIFDQNITGINEAMHNANVPENSSILVHMVDSTSNINGL
jgi:hypothetical protein